MDDQPPASPSQAGSRIPELDGLRGVAIALVVVAHYALGEYPTYRPMIPALHWNNPGGGFIGVQLFFVLSGYLITSILKQELDGTGRVQFKAFYIRRVRRLLPALLLVVAGYLLLEVLLYPDRVTLAAGAAFYAVTYTTDLTWVFHPFAESGFLGHTWSLAVEEQFYLVWPVLLVGARRIRRELPVIVALTGILVTVIIRQVVGASSPATYTTLRWDALFIGCLLALVPVRLPRGSGVAAAAVILGFAIYVPDPIPNWAYAVATLACGVALVRAFDARWLRNPVLRHLGRISYGLYLWHALLMRYPIPPVLALTLSVVAAEVSFAYVEKRFLRPSQSLSSADAVARPS
jgi:peptidoglycan/LPS O-acetylase OafA/YrhL